MKSLHILIVTLVLIGALNTSLNVFGTDLIDSLGKNTSESISTILYILIGISLFYVVFDRHTYLPFLGESVFPCNVLEQSVPDNASLSVRVKTVPDTLIVYWAAEPGVSDNRTPEQAYGRYGNSGVAQSNSDGIAILKVRPPVGYDVPTRKLASHIHYRECVNNNMLGEVKTISV